MIFGIVFTHMPGSMRVFSEYLAPVYKYGGDISLPLFFMLSGFLTCYAYEKRVDQTKLGSFIFRRIKSVYFLYFVTETAALMMAVKGNGAGPLNIKSLVLNYTMTGYGWVEESFPNNVPAWFFSTLLLDYIVWFVIAKYAKEGRHYFYLGMIIVGLILIKLDVHFPFMYMRDGDAFAGFFEGCILFSLWQERTQRGKSMYLFVGITAALTVICLITAFLTDFPTAAGDWNHVNDWRYAWYCAFDPLLIMSALSVGWFRRFLRSRPMRLVFGNINQYIFFWHWPFMLMGEGVMMKLFPESMNLRGACFLIGLYVFCVIYREIERRGRKYVTAKLAEKGRLQ